MDLADRARLVKPVDHYDVIIIGTGAGGGTLAHRLAPSGKKILLLERGGYLPRERENWDSKEVFDRERYVTTERWYDKHGVAFRPHAQYFVGGNTKVYGGVLFRLRERDFREVEHYGGVSPAWPISYSDLEPYYAQAERLYLVHGQAGEDPTEPPRSGPFPYPAVSHEPRIQQLHDDLVAPATSRSTCPSASTSTRSDPEAGRCVRCDRFDGFPCLTDGKGRRPRRLRAPALKHPNVTLRTHAEVTRLEPTPPDARSRGSSSSAAGDRGGLQRRHRGGLVRRGQLRRAAAALGERRAPQRAGELLRRRRPALHGAPELGGDRDLPDAERHQVPEDARAQRLLLGRRRLGASRSGTSRCSASQTRNILRAARRGSRPGSRSTTSPGMRSTSGSPPRTSPTPTTASRSIARGTSTSPRPTTTPSRTGGSWRSSRTLLGPLGCHRTSDPTVVGAQPADPARRHRPQLRHRPLRHRPRRSALDVNCKAHDLDNLYVVDTSFFPSSSAVNPSLTAIANALRVGDHLLERLGAPAVTSAVV